MQTLLEDIQFAFRSFLKTPAICGLIVATLALGIGANAAVFSMVHNILYAPLPFTDGEQLVKINTNHPEIERYDVLVSVPTALDYIDKNSSFSHLVEYHQMPFTLFGYGDPANVEGGVVSWDFFEMLGIRPMLGRTFLPGEDEPGAKALVILSFHYWREKFGSDPGIIGTNLEMNDKSIQIIGVLPPLPTYPFKNDIWMGSSSCPGRGSASYINGRDKPISKLYGKMKSQTNLSAATVDLNSISNRLMSQFPEVYPQSQGLVNSLTPMRVDMLGDSKTIFFLLMGITLLVLLIACANVANLNLSRTASRTQELAVREALGANPRRIARQVFTESILLSFIGGLGGLLIAFFCIDLLVSFASLYTPLASEVKINSSVLGFCLIVSLITGVLSGATAAFQKRNINEVLKEGSGNITASITSKKLKQAMLILQFALAFIILLSATLMTQSLYRLMQQQTGFETDKIISVSLSKSANDRRQFVKETVLSLTSKPGINDVAYASVIPLVTGMHHNPFFQIEGRQLASSSQQASALKIAVSANYHSLLNIGLLQGRYLTPADDENNPGSILVNQHFADVYFAKENPIGKRITQDNGVSWLTIRGVVSDVREFAIDTEPVATFYYPYMEGWQYELKLLVKGETSVEDLRPLISATIHQFNPRQPIADITTMSLVVEDWLSAPKLVSLLVCLLALLAFLITLSGIIGVVANNINQRRKEIGIRVALGADPQRIRALFVMQGLSLTVIGLILGAVIMAFLSPLLSNLLFATDSFDLVTYLIMAIVITLVTAVAILLPIKQATAIQPNEALREQ